MEAEGDPGAIELRRPGRRPEPLRIEIGREALRLVPEGSPPVEIGRSEAWERVEVMKLPLGGFALGVRLDRLRVYPLEPGPRARLAAWLGPPPATFVGAWVRRRVGGIALAIAALNLFEAAAFPGGRLRALALGLALLALALLARFRPRRALLLPIAFLFFVFAAQNAAAASSVVSGRSALAIFALAVGWSWIGAFRRFACTPVGVAAPAPQGHSGFGIASVVAGAGVLAAAGGAIGGGALIAALSAGSLPTLEAASAVFAPLALLGATAGLLLAVFGLADGERKPAVSLAGFLLNGALLAVLVRLLGLAART